MTGLGPLEFGFMRHAFAATTCVAIAGSLVGYFVVLRRQAFAAHALGNIGFAGAAGASLVGVTPMTGLFVFVLLAALFMASAGEQIGNRDITVGMILMVSLGLGIWFVNLYSANADAAIGILFGSVLGIDDTQLGLIVAVSLVVVIVLAALFRPLRFASLNAPAARARGLPVAAISTLFLLLLAGISAVTVPVIGALLSFAIFVGPAATAQAWTGRVANGLVVTIAIALVQCWAGLTISYYADIPPTSCIAALSFVFFAVSRVGSLLMPRRYRHLEPHRATGDGPSRSLQSP